MPKSDVLLATAVKTQARPTAHSSVSNASYLVNLYGTDGDPYTSRRSSSAVTVNKF